VGWRLCLERQGYEFRGWCVTVGGAGEGSVGLMGLGCRVGLSVVVGWLGSVLGR